MSGLIEKDVRLVLHRKQTLLIFLAVAVIMGFSVNGEFLVGYLTMLGAIVAVSTLNYDEYDNGFAFLMTLPFDRETYVLGKYLFCLLISAAAWCAGCVLYLAGGLIRGTVASAGEELIGLLAVLPTMFLVTSIMIPLQLKYGQEKSRIVLFAVFGIVALASQAAPRLFPGTGTGWVRQLVIRLDSAPPIAVLLSIIAVCALLAAASCLWSVRIMEKKEF